MKNQKYKKLLSEGLLNSIASVNGFNIEHYVINHKEFNPRAKWFMVWAIGSLNGAIHSYNNKNEMLETLNDILCRGNDGYYYAIFDRNGKEYLPQIKMFALSKNHNEI